MAKRRAGHAPPGSGVPVGTEYHWYILAHQNVRKLDANTYTTGDDPALRPPDAFDLTRSGVHHVSLTGLKYKLAHKRAEKDAWSATEQAQRRQLIKILEENLSAEMLSKRAPCAFSQAAKSERGHEADPKKEYDRSGPNQVYSNPSRNDYFPQLCPNYT